MDDEAESKLLNHWVQIYEEFESAYRQIYVENVEKKKKKAHVDFAHNEPLNNHLNAAVLHEPQAKWCIVLCLDAMLSTALAVNVNDQTSVAAGRRTFNQHQALRTSILHPKPIRPATPPVLEDVTLYDSMVLPGLYCPQPGYYVPCPSKNPPVNPPIPPTNAANPIPSGGQKNSSNPEEESLPSLGYSKPRGCFPTQSVLLPSGDLLSLPPPVISVEPSHIYLARCGRLTPLVLNYVTAYTHSSSHFIIVASLYGL